MVTLYDPDGALAAVDTVAVQPSLRLASSKWHGFFYHEGLTDEVHARVVATPLRTARSRCTRFVEERTMCVFFFFSINGVTQFFSNLMVLYHHYFMQHL
jgi:hypothetical protein